MELDKKVNDITNIAKSFLFLAESYFTDFEINGVSN